MAPPAVLAPWRTVVDERAARRTMRAQIAQLEARLTDAVASSFPRGGIATHVPYAGGPRLLSLDELELSPEQLLPESLALVLEVSDEQPSLELAE